MQYINNHLEVYALQEVYPEILKNGGDYLVCLSGSLSLGITRLYILQRWSKGIATQDLVL